MTTVLKLDSKLLLYLFKTVIPSSGSRPTASWKPHRISIAELLQTRIITIDLHSPEVFTLLLHPARDSELASLDLYRCEISLK